MDLNIRKLNDSVTPQIDSILRSIGMSGKRRLLLATAQEFQRETKANFGGGNDTYKDKRWPSYSRAYTKKKGKSQPDLKVTGALMNSIKIGSPRSNWIEVYTKHPYAAAQGFGYRPRNLPARQFFPVQMVGSSYSRPTYNSQRDMTIVISKMMTLLSGGVLPRQSPAVMRMMPSYGSPFTGPSAVPS